MLEAILNCNHPLPERWHVQYGLTTDRKRTLLGSFPERNSFRHPVSETALTLFMLGNMDGWKQLGQLHSSPRDTLDRWSSNFFDRLRDSETLAAPCHSTLWRHLRKGPFADTTLDWARSILLFEFEVMNSAFHTVNHQPFKKLSFLDIQGNRKWGAFDAFMIVPSTAPTPNCRGALIGFEAKLGSDISPNTKGFTHVNQVMRNLEAGYWLTHHPESLYLGWDFHYVFICPRLTFELKAAQYSWMLFDLTSLEKTFASYRKVLAHHRADVDQRQFDEFVTSMLNRVNVLHWDDFANALQQENEMFWASFIDRLRELPECIDLFGATVQRLHFAGVSVPRA